MIDNETREPIDFTDGRWIATTMGNFIQILIDSGNDPAIIFRVEEDRSVSDKSFIRKMTVYSVPNGAVVGTCEALDIIDSDTHGVYKVLQELIAAGLVT